MISTTLPQPRVPTPYLRVPTPYPRVATPCLRVATPCSRVDALSGRDRAVFVRVWNWYTVRPPLGRGSLRRRKVRGVPQERAAVGLRRAVPLRSDRRAGDEVMPEALAHLRVGGKHAVGVEPVTPVGVFLVARPRDSRSRPELRVGQSGVVTQPAAGALLPRLESALRIAPPDQRTALVVPQVHPPGVVQEDVQIAARRTGWVDGLVREVHGPVDVGVGALFLAPERRGQHHVGVLGGLGAEPVLHHHEQVRIPEDVAHPAPRPPPCAAGRRRRRGAGRRPRSGRARGSTAPSGSPACCARSSTGRHSCRCRCSCRAGRPSRSSPSSRPPRSRCTAGCCRPCAGCRGPCGPSLPWLTTSPATPRTPTVRPPTTAMSHAHPLLHRTHADRTQRSTSSPVTPSSSVLHAHGPGRVPGERRPGVPHVADAVHPCPVPAQPRVARTHRDSTRSGLGSSPPRTPLREHPAPR